MKTAKQTGMKHQIRLLMAEANYGPVRVSEERSGKLRWYTVVVLGTHSNYPLRPVHDRMAEAAVRELMADRGVAGGVDVWTESQ
jgi:hypothetical protein